MTTFLWLLAVWVAFCAGFLVGCWFVYRQVTFDEVDEHTSLLASSYVPRKPMAVMREVDLNQPFDAYLTDIDSNQKIYEKV